MTCRSFHIALAVFSLMVMLPVAALSQSDDQKAYEMVAYYFDLIVSGNYESAVDFWEISAIERAHRLGIEYDDAPVKPDCSSPVVYDRERLRYDLYHGIKSKSVIDSGLIQLKFSADIDGGKIYHSYLAKKLGDDFWLVYSQDYYTRDWPVFETRYFRFHINPNRIDYYNDIAAASMDKFVEKMAGKIGITSERLSLLAEQKVDYYLCLDKIEVRKFTDRHEAGVYETGADAIFSIVFPDYHLTSLLLTNFKMQKLPQFAIPALRAGLGIYLGGRWQRSPEVIIDFGEYILDYNLTEVDSILVEDNPASDATGDITYPIDACLVDFLMTELGTDKFFELYRTLSGSYETVITMSIDSIKTAMAGFLNTDWTGFKKKFNIYFAGRETHGGLIFPGEVAADKVLIEQDGLLLAASDKWLTVDYTDSGNDNIDVNILFDKSPELAGKVSSLFEEQYHKQREYEGYRFGIKLDQNEIGLYDYATNQLRAKYVVNFDPDPAYFDEGKGQIKAYFDISLLNGAVPDNSDYMILK
jgi:hypothetical protein